MPRRPDPSIRRRLRDRAVDYVLAHGFAELSLRPLAKELGTNARMLVYHFGSREGLMRAILGGLREREDARIRSWFSSARRPRTIAQFVRWYWRRLTAPDARSAGKLIFELYALALRDPQSYPGVLEDPVGYWKQLLERAGMPPTPRSDVLATVLLATMRGLLLDLLATGDEKRVTRAMSAMLRMLAIPEATRRS